MKRALLFIPILVLLLLSNTVTAQSNSSLVLTMNVDGAIAPAMREYVERSIEIADRRDADLLVMYLNTPGGAVDAMKSIVEAMRASRVPIVVYVFPRGAWAGSAGTPITLAGHAAAMAPETVIGAASPVGGQGEDLNETLRAKETEVLTATVRSLTERRGEEAIALAQATITEARAVSATEALAAGLIDFIATDIDDLLAQLHGYQVYTIEGTMVLDTQDPRVESIPLTFIEQLLALLTNPNIVFLLLSIGVQAIFIELSSPGGWVAGFIGVTFLLLATYGLGVLPVNWFGFLFLLVSFILFILEIKTPAYGALTVAGIASFIIGALVLFNSPGTPQFQQVSVPLVVAMAVTTGAMFAFVITFAIRALRVPDLMGQKSLKNKIGTATINFTPNGQVQLDSELWTAEPVPGSSKIRKGDKVEVVEVHGLRLKVRKVK